MNKKIVVFSLAVGFLAAGLVMPMGRVLARTSNDQLISELQAQVNALLVRIQQLQEQSAALQGGQSQVNNLQTPGGVGPVVNIDPSQKFAINDRVQSTFDLNVRVAPGGNAVAVVPPHTKGTITGGPQQGGAYWWWQISYDNGASGYSVGDFLEKVDVLVSETTGNKAPVLSGDAFVSPTSVGVNDSNWWRLEGTDPEGGSIIYKVEWGDGTSDTYTLASGGSTPARHTFSSAGNFQLKLMATDQAGASVSRLITVSVIDSSQTLNQPSTKFKIGDMVQATDNLNVRTGPSGVPVGVQLVGAKATVVGGPVWSIVGKWWWNLDYQTGVDGWSAEDWLTKTGTSVVTNTCGDINVDSVINASDTTMYQNYIFSGGTVPAGVKTDLNGDGVSDVFDLNALIGYLYSNGPAPTCQATTTGNRPPVIENFSGPSSLVVGQSGRWSLEVSDPDGDAYTWKISWGDDSGSVSCTFGCERTFGESHTYNQIGPKVITVIATDSKGALSAPLITTVTINATTTTTNNLPRIVSVPTLPSRIEVNQNVQFSWTATDPDGDALGWGVDWGSDVTQGNMAVSICAVNCPNTYTVSHAWTRTGSYTVTATVTDSKGGSASHSFKVEVLPAVFACGDINVDSVINASDTTMYQNYIFSGGTVPTGVKTDLNGDGVSDVFDLNTLIGYLYSNGPAPTCVAAAQQNLSPVISGVSGQTSLSAQQSGAWTVSASDPNNDVLYYSVAWGDGGENAPQIGSSFSHTYWTAGSYSARFTANDGRGGVVNSDKTITVSGPTPTNQPPVVSTVLGPTSLNIQQLGTWAILASDSNGDALTYSATWGDGGSNVPQSGSSLTHTYSAAGSYIPRFTVNDGKGGVVSSDKVVTVSGSSSYACGDINADSLINASDTTMYQNYIFSGWTVPSGVKTDLNGDGVSDVFDLNTLIGYLYSNGPAPTCVAPQPPKTNLPAGASVLDSIGSQLNAVSALLNQLMSQIGR